jgi:hypothetical protein
MDKSERAHWERREREEGFVRVRFRLLTTEEGGRRGPIADGYRACWDIGNRTDGGERMFNDAPLLIEDGDEWIAPGSGGVARIHPLVPEFWADVRPGLEVAMYEGSRVVGRGQVLEVVGPTVENTSGN